MGETVLISFYGLIGCDRRPVFTYPRYTMHMLEHYMKRAKITNSGREKTSSLTTNLWKPLQLMLHDNEYDKVTKHVRLRVIL